MISNFVMGQHLKMGCSQDLAKNLAMPACEKFLQDFYNEQKILLVDDDPDMHRFYAAILATRWCHLSYASDGKEAIEKIQKESPTLLICDLSMPGMDGRSLLLKIKRIAPNLPVIIVSAKEGMKTDPELQMIAQIRCFLTKPLQVPTLLQTVDQVLKGQKNTSPAPHPHAMGAPIPASTREETSIVKKTDGLEPRMPAAMEKKTFTRTIQQPAISASFSGCIEHIGLFPILQMLGMEGKTGALALQHQDESALIYISEGKILHCVVGESEGMDAFCRLFFWKDGKFEFQLGRKSPRVTINQPIEYLLLEGARLMDEQSQPTMV